MNDHQIDEIIRLLSDATNVPKPNWRWCARQVSFYHGRGWLIDLSRYDWHGLEDALLHEFAHHITNVRNGTCYHDRWCYLAVKEVAEAWYGDAKKYGWSKEYASLQRWARMDKLLGEEVRKQWRPGMNGVKHG